MTNSQILDAINQNIKRNENKEITGVILNSVLRMLLDFVNQGFITFSDIIQLLADSKAINVVGSINTTTNTTSLPSGVYHAQISGTYTNAGNIVVKEGYYTLLRKKDDGSWVLESEVKMPMQDLTKIETELESTKTKVDDFIENFSVEVDQEFDENSENAISNKEVSKLAKVLSGYISEGKEELLAYEKLTNKIIDKNGNIVGNNYWSVLKITLSEKYNKLLYNGHKVGFLNQSDMDLYMTLIAKKSDNSYITLIGNTNTNKVNIINEIVNVANFDLKELYINISNVQSVTPFYSIKGISVVPLEDNAVNNYIDVVSSFDYQIQNYLNDIHLEVEESPINSETIGIDLNSNSSSSTGKIYLNNLSTKGYGKITEIRFKSDVEKYAQTFFIYKKLPNNKVRLLNFAYCPNVVVGVNIFKPRNFICEKDCVIGTYANNVPYTSGGNNQYFEVSGINFELNSESNHALPQSGYFPIIFDVDYKYRENVKVITFKSEVLSPIDELLNNNNYYISLNNTLNGGCISFIDDDQPTPVYEWLIPLFLKYKIPIGIAFISNVNNTTDRDKIARMYNKKHSDLVEFYNHTKTHRSSHNVDNYETQFEEINYCHNYMINNLGITPKGYVSPWGRFNQTTLDIISKLGYNQHYRFDSEIETNSVDDFFNLGIKRVNFGFNSGGFPYISSKDVLIDLINQTVLNNEWLVITTHYRKTGGVISTFKQDIEEVLQYLKSNNIRVLLPSKAFELYRNIIEVDNGFRITKNGTLKTEHINYSYR